MVVSAAVYSTPRTEVRPPAMDLQLPLNNCLYTLRPSIPHLTLSSLHGGLRWQGIGRLP
jgi:hypothetical protein